MKRFLSIFICLALLSGLCLPIFAVSEAARCRTLYVRTSLPWRTAYLWASEENIEIFGSMPGTKMFRDGATFHLCIPDDLTEFTLTGNGTDTIGPIAAEADQDLYVTVDTDGTAQVEYGGFSEDNVLPEPTQPTTQATEPTTPAEPITDDATDTRTLTIIPPSSWTTVEVYTWEPEDFGAWPGSKLTKSGDVYKVDIKNSMVNLVIATEQADTTYKKTDDIKLETNDKDVTITVNEDCSYKIEYAGGSSSSNGGTRKPAAADPQGTPSSYRVVGNAAWLGSWQADNPNGVMIEVAPGVYRKTFKDVEPGSYAIRITKDGQWEGAYGDINGDNYNFTVDRKASITVDFTLKDGIGVISVYGQGVPACDGDEDDPHSPQGSSSSGRKPAASDPQPTDPGSADSQVTQPADPGTSDPQITEPVDPGNEQPTEPWRPAVDTTPDNEPSSGSPEPNSPDIAPTQPSAPASADSSQRSPSALVNLPVHSAFMFLFGIVAVFVYLLFLLAKRNRISGDITPDGKLQCRSRLSTGAVAKAVKANMPAPPETLDQSVLEAIEKIRKPPAES